MDFSEMSSAYYRVVFDELFSEELLNEVNSLIGSPDSYTSLEISNMMTNIKNSIMKVKGMADVI